MESQASPSVVMVDAMAYIEGDSLSYEYHVFDHRFSLSSIKHQLPLSSDTKLALLSYRRLQYTILRFYKDMFLVIIRSILITVIP